MPGAYIFSSGRNMEAFKAVCFPASSIVQLTLNNVLYCSLLPPHFPYSNSEATAAQRQPHTASCPFTFCG